MNIAKKFVGTEHSNQGMGLNTFHTGHFMRILTSFTDIDYERV